MLFLLSWLIYGLIVGFLAKKLHPGEDPVGWIPTLFVGVVGSYVGGFVYYLLSMNLDSFRPAGLLFSIIGGVVFLYIWRMYVKQKNNR